MVSSSRPQSARSGLYVHVPFCSSICPYCDFAVMKGDAARRAAFVAALIDESALWSSWPGSFDTVYFGGGTPSILSAEELERILAALSRHLDLAGDARLALEANPEDVSAASVQAWRRLGFRTLSLGVQSFDQSALAFLGRRHAAAESFHAGRVARAAGFETVSLDLIYGLPGHTPDGWRRDLDAAVGLEVDHLSCYQLTVHAKTVFGVRRRRGQLCELDGEAQADLFFDTHRRLAAAGYEAYEVSNFATAPQHRSRHNMKYWDHSPYLGLGPSAHSFDGNRRWWNERKEGPWRRRVLAGERPIAEREELTTPALVFECLMLGFRTAAGVDLGDIRRRYGVDLETANEATIAELVANGDIESRRGVLVPTLAGLARADSLALAFEIP